MNEGCLNVMSSKLTTRGGSKKAIYVYLELTLSLQCRLLDPHHLLLTLEHGFWARHSSTHVVSGCGSLGDMSTTASTLWRHRMEMAKKQVHVYSIRHTP